MWTWVRGGSKSKNVQVCGGTFMPAYCSVPSDFSYAAYCIRMCSEVFLMLKLREIDGKK